MAVITEVMVGEAIGLAAGTRLTGIHAASVALCRGFLGIAATADVSETVPEDVFNEGIIRCAAWLKNDKGMLTDTMTVGDATIRHRPLGNVFRQSGAGTILAPFVDHRLQIVGDD